MVQKIGGRLIFTYGCSKKSYQGLRLTRPNLKLSLLGILMGIFLLPNLAYLSSITPEKLIELTNQERQTAGLNVLTSSQLLAEAAMAKAKAIMETQTFKHTINDKKFSGWVRDTGYDYSYVGENLAIDFTTSESVIAAWENSPLHKKNLLSPYYREIGLAAVAGEFMGQDTTVVVQIFGAPAVASTAPLPPYYQTNLLNSNSLSVNFNSAIKPYGRIENLSAGSIIYRQSLPVSSQKLTLPASEYLSGRMNKIIIQPEFRASAGNFIMPLAFLALIYLAIILSSNFLSNSRPAYLRFVKN